MSTISERVKTIPQGGWSDEESEAKFALLAESLINKGVTPDEAFDFLARLFNVVKQEVESGKKAPKVEPKAAPKVEEKAPVKAEEKFVPKK